MYNIHVYYTWLLCVRMFTLLYTPLYYYVPLTHNTCNTTGRIYTHCYRINGTQYVCVCACVCVYVCVCVCMSMCMCVCVL